MRCHFAFQEIARKLTLPALLTLTVAAATARATPLFEVRFTGDTPGTAPSAEPATDGGVSTKPTIIVAQGDNSVLVQNTYTDSLSGNVFGDGNVMVSTDVGNGAANAMVFQGTVGDEVNSGVHTISLDWMEDSGITATSSFFIGLTNQTRGQALSALFLDLGEPAGNVRSGNSVNFGATLGTVSRGVPHHLDWVIDLDQADFSIATEVYVDGVLMAVHRRDPIGVPHDGASAFGNLSISSSGPAVGVMAFDNILIRSGRHVVPEPSGIAILGVGGLIGAIGMIRRARS